MYTAAAPSALGRVHMAAWVPLVFWAPPLGFCLLGPSVSFPGGGLVARSLVSLVPAGLDQVLVLNHCPLALD